MPETRDLDTRIRELVARAVADAPAPPDVDPEAIPEAEPDHGHRRGRWLGGLTVLAAAAAAILAFVVVRDTEPDRLTPVTPQPTVPPSPAPTAPTPTPAPSTTAAPSSTAVPGAGEEPAVLTAGPDGVVERRGGVGRSLTTDPMAIALDAGDGRIIVQRERGFLAESEADTYPLVLTRDGSLDPLFPSHEWGGDVVLHDIEVVAGRRLLLYSVQVGQERPDTAEETLYVVDLDGATPAPTEIAVIGGWESGTGRLHLAATGLVVGEWSGGASHGVETHAVPGSPSADAGVPSFADLGLQETYDDCTDCPTAFTVTPDGGSIAWVDRGRLYEISLERLDAGAVEIARVPDGLITELDLGRDALVSFFADPPRAPVRVPLDGADPVELEGVIATYGPLGGASSATEPPQAGTVASLLSTGLAGVARYEGGEVRVLTYEPMAIALDAGNGDVIVQRGPHHPPLLGEGEADSTPLVLSEDGTLTPLFARADWDGEVVLHDIEVVAGRRLLLYSLREAWDDPEAATEDLFVLDLDTEQATQVAAGIGHFGLSTGRLHLATTGLIVGESFTGPTGGIEIHAVPGSPAAEGDVPTAADLGLTTAQGECATCSRLHAVTPDGGTIAWVEGDQLRTVALGPPIGDPVTVASVPDESANELDLGPAGALFAFATDPGRPAELMPPDGSSPIELLGTRATFPPSGVVAPGPDPAAECGVDPDAPAIDSAIGEIPPAFDGFPGWAHDGDSNYDPCAALSYAVAVTRGGTATSPAHVLLFHDGAFVGTATECAFGFTSVTDTTADSVTVEYRWPLAGEPSAAPSGLASVTYRWNGTSVQASSELPEDLLAVSGCR